MKRRSFLGLLAGAAVAPAVADGKVPQTTQYDGLEFVETNGRKMLFENYSCNGRSDGVTSVSCYVGDVFTIKGDSRTFEIVHKAGSA